jgi:hypothetical protein
MDNLGEDVTPGAYATGQVVSGIASAVPGFVGFTPDGDMGGKIIFDQITQMSLSTARSINALQESIAKLTAVVENMPRGYYSEGSATPSHNPADYADPVNPMNMQQIQALNASAL